MERLHSEFPRIGKLRLSVGTTTVDTVMTGCIT